MIKKGFHLVFHSPLPALYPISPAPLVNDGLPLIFGPIRPQSGGFPTGGSNDMINGRLDGGETETEKSTMVAVWEISTY